MSGIVCNSNRICAVEVNNNCNGKIILISVYMPCNDNSREAFLDFGDTLNEISSLMHVHSDHKFLIGGDFNVDFSKISTHRDILTNS